VALGALTGRRRTIVGMDEARALLEAALARDDPTERKLAVAAVVNLAVQAIGFRAVVIGGLAVEFWTQGEYTTADIDLYLPWTPQVDAAMAAVGFVKEGRHWTLPGHDIFVEAPANVPREHEEIDEVALPTGAAVLVLAVEDVIVDRLHQFVAGGHSDVLEQAVALLAVEEVDYPRLTERAAQEGLRNALIEVERISQRLRRGEVVPSWELQEIARRLRKPGVD
jgi:hypothetical protein